MCIRHVYLKISYRIRTHILRYVYPIQWDMISYDICILFYHILSINKIWYLVTKHNLTGNNGFTSFTVHMPFHCTILDTLSIELWKRGINTRLMTGKDTCSPP